MAIDIRKDVVGYLNDSEKCEYMAEDVMEDM
jgi:hypothetical protein